MDDTELRVGDQLGEVRESTAEERHRAALTVCRNAGGSEDAARLLEMLGLTGALARKLATLCRRCDRPMSNVALIGHARRGRDGMCESCYRKAGVQ
ncbi:hypothetical protein [Nocardia sp. SC052]|uniref:hypothetical protein n=1 Tax=Nocardia sichangensis TaxID=3385975 RepID=UPI0039A02A79